MKSSFVSLLAVLSLTSCYYTVPAPEYYIDDGYADEAGVYVVPEYAYSQSSYVRETYYTPYGGTMYVEQTPGITYIDNYAPEVVYIDNPLLHHRDRRFGPEPRHHVKPHHHDNFKPHHEPHKGIRGKESDRERSHKQKPARMMKGKPEKLAGVK